MLKILYTLSEKFRDKNIYIYGITRNSINIFTDLAYRGTNICGFVETNGRYVGEQFMNRPIVGKDGLSGACDVVILWEGVPKGTAEQELPGIEVFYADEALDIDYRLKHKKVVIYGIGERGEEIYGLLAERGIKAAAACVTEKKQDIWHGLKVYGIEELRDNPDMAVIVAVRLQKYKNAMLEKIKEFRAEKYIDEFVPAFWAREGDLFQIVNVANTNQKEIYLYGNDAEATEFVESILNRYDISVQARIYKTGIPEQNIENIYELAYKDTDNITVVVAEQNRKESQWVCETLDDIGFSLGGHDYTAICSKTAEHRNTMKNMADCLVGHTDVGNGKMTGYVVYGTEEEADIRIMVLGGSTSTEGHYRPVSWVCRFYQKLRKRGCKAVLYNGAACGYDIAQELLRLLRDGPCLKPDYVISLSGVNNINSKQRTDNPFCVDTFIDWLKALAPDRDYYSGVRSDETLYDFWYRNTKVMKTASELAGAKFYSFLQPMRLCKKDLTLFEISMHELGDSLKNTLMFKERAGSEKDQCYYSLIDLFDDVEGTYIDYCHYSDKGNQMIADIIFDAIFYEHTAPGFKGLTSTWK